MCLGKLVRVPSLIFILCARFFVGVSFYGLFSCVYFSLVRMDEENVAEDFLGRWGVLYSVDVVSREFPVDLLQIQLYLKFKYPQNIVRTQ